MPSNRDFSVSILVGGVELPEYQKDGEYFVESNLFTPVSYTQQSEELVMGEIEKQGWPVTPYQIRVTAKTNTPYSYYKVFVDGQKASQIAVKPGRSCVSEGFYDGVNITEFLFSLPRLPQNKKDRLDKGKASKVGRIEVECWNSKVTGYKKPVMNKLEYSQANKKDSGTVTQGDYIMATTKVGRSVRTTQKSTVEDWTLFNVRSKIAIRYAMGHSLIDMGFILRPIRIPIHRIPASVLSPSAPGPLSMKRKRAAQTARKSTSPPVPQNLPVVELDLDVIEIDESDDELVVGELIPSKKQKSEEEDDVVAGTSKDDAKENDVEMVGDKDDNQIKEAKVEDEEDDNEGEKDAADSEKDKKKTAEKTDSKSDNDDSKDKELGEETAKKSSKDKDKQTGETESPEIKLEILDVYTDTDVAKDQTSTENPNESGTRKSGEANKDQAEDDGRKDGSEGGNNDSLSKDGAAEDMETGMDNDDNQNNKDNDAAKDDSNDVDLGEKSNESTDGKQNDENESSGSQRDDAGQGDGEDLGQSEEGSKDNENECGVEKEMRETGDALTENDANTTDAQDDNSVSKDGSQGGRSANEADEAADAGGDKAAEINPDNDVDNITDILNSIEAPDASGDNTVSFDTDVKKGENGEQDGGDIQTTDDLLDDDLGPVTVNPEMALGDELILE